MTTPALIVHGGAGAMEHTEACAAEIAARLHAVVDAAHATLVGAGARAAVIHAVALLEDDPLFNAGTGAKLQADGVARLSAALIDSSDGVFSGVINVERVSNPVAVAERLSRERHHVLAADGANAFARAQGLPEHDPVTPQRQREWREARRGDTGTVGAVALDAGGVLAAATSTGGVGHEHPGRVSDSATVAGTYAARQAGVSMTGIGEQIVSHAAAARIVVRCEDGMALADAVARSLDEARRHDWRFGLIALDARGAIVADQVGDVQTMFAARRGEWSTSFAEASRVAHAGGPAA